jgi:hypothetical protein
MVTFLALYRSASLATAELVAVSIDPTLVAAVAKTLLLQPVADTPPSEDPVLRSLSTGKRRALTAVHAEVTRLVHGE